MSVRGEDLGSGGSTPGRRRSRPPLGIGGAVPVGLQVVVGIGLLVALCAASVAVAVFLLVGLKNEASGLHDREVPYATATAAAALAAKGVANDERGFLLTKDAAFVSELNDRIAVARGAFDSAARAAANEPQREAVEVARSGFERWVLAVRAELRAVAAGEGEDGAETTMAPARALRKTNEASLAHATALATSGIESGESSMAASASRSIIILLACLLGALVAATGVAFWLVRTILKPVYGVLSLFAELGDAHAPLSAPGDRTSG
jgi:methyl-accepting chemotaxis protein